MSLPNLDGKYTSGKRRKKLFSDSPRRKVAIPASIVIIGILLLLFWLVPVYTVEPILPIQPYPPSPMGRVTRRAWFRGRSSCCL